MQRPMQQPLSVVVVAADIDPLQSIWRPHSAPTAIVGRVSEGRANERKAIEAVVDEGAPVMEREPRRECSMRSKRRTRKASAAKPRAGAHSAEARSAAYSADMHPSSSSHGADMHPSSHSAGMHAAAATAAAAKGKRR